MGAGGIYSTFDRSPSRKERAFKRTKTTIKTLMRKRTGSEHWMQYTWRPIASFVYLAICISDFIIFPVLWSTMQYHTGNTVLTQWIPITMSNSGFIHLSFGAILGISAWTRGYEKIEANKGKQNEE